MFAYCGIYKSSSWCGNPCLKFLRSKGWGRRISRLACAIRWDLKQISRQTSKQRMKPYLLMATESMRCLHDSPVPDSVVSHPLSMTLRQGSVNCFEIKVSFEMKWPAYLVAIVFEHKYYFCQLLTQWYIYSFISDGDHCTHCFMYTKIMLYHRYPSAPPSCVCVCVCSRARRC